MREPSSGAIVTEQRVRHCIQISGLNSTQLKLCVNHGTLEEVDWQCFELFVIFIVTVVNHVEFAVQ